MKTVIMAGGRGTRISSVASDVPKPMIKIWAMRDLMYIPFEFEDGGARVIHYTPEIYVP